MGIAYSLRFKLLMLYFLTIIIPTAILVIIMPSYYQGLISNEAKVLTDSVSTALVKNIETYLDDLERLTITPYYNDKFMNSLELLTSEEYEKNNNYTKLVIRQEILYIMNDYLQNTRKDILSTVLATNDGIFYIATKKQGMTNPPDNYNYRAESWYKQALAADGKAVFINAHSQTYLNSPVADRVFSVTRLIKDTNSGKGLAVIMADADTLILQKILSDVKFNVTSIVSIFDNESNLIYSNHRLSDEILRQIKDKQQLIRDSDDTYTIVSKPIELTKWNIVILLSNSEMKSKFNLIYTMGILFALAQLIIAFSLFTFFSRFITDPFKRMIHVMKMVEKGDLSVRYMHIGRDEISRLGNALNNMVARLNELIDREYRAVLSKRNAEFYALQSQINPHFLYNVLNSLIGLNRLDEKMKLEESILALTGMMRYTIHHDDFGTIAEEFLLLRRYCELQKLRFDERFEFGLNYDDSISKYKIPRLLLQPLVENAIIHGIEPLDRNGSVFVRAMRIEKSNRSLIEISVIDNGYGFDVSTHNHKKSVGLFNVEERLKITYSHSTMKIESKIGEGTSVIIEIPEEEMQV